MSAPFDSPRGASSPRPQSKPAARLSKFTVQASWLLFWRIPRPAYITRSRPLNSPLKGSVTRIHLLEGCIIRSLSVSPCLKACIAESRPPYHCLLLGVAPIQGSPIPANFTKRALHFTHTSRPLVGLTKFNYVESTRFVRSFGS